jgi:S-adenosylmethionine:tRNA ribosyltransferase-isomerase
MKKLDKNIAISDFSYDLPQERIAEFPIPKRDDSKLLVYRNGEISEDRFYNVEKHLPGESLLVLNNTRVIEARIIFQKGSGAFIEVFCLEPYLQSIETAMKAKGNSTWKCLIGGASKWKPGQVLEKQVEACRLEARYVSKMEDYFLIEFSWQPEEKPFVEVLHGTGAIPLPPYIKRKAEQLDQERYQTIFSINDGSVAAPTAALHFTPEVFSALEEKKITPAYVTLHVGAGTFKPVKTETIADHHMHGEPFSVHRDTIEAIINAPVIISVGTTSIRTLESLYWLGIKLKNDPGAELLLGQWEAYELAKPGHEISKEESLGYLISWLKENNKHSIQCRTSMIIVPGYKAMIPDALITNFHQPQSTLLLLVSAFIGDDWKKVYDHAMKNDFRFLSYGDSSLLWKKKL